MTENNGEIIFAVEEAPGGGYIARALDHSIFTEANSLDALRNSDRSSRRWRHRRA
jgi:hypothetical protein